MHGHAVAVISGDEAENKADQGDAEIGYHFGGNDFQRPDGCDEEGFQCAPFPFPGHDQGGQEDADQGHDDDDESGDEHP